jgi:hypothetical protein
MLLFGLDFGCTCRSFPSLPFWAYIVCRRILLLLPVSHINILPVTVSFNQHSSVPSLTRTFNLLCSLRPFFLVLHLETYNPGRRYGFIFPVAQLKTPERTAANSGFVSQDAGSYELHDHKS